MACFQGQGEILGIGCETSHETSMLDSQGILDGVWFHAGFKAGFKDQGEFWGQGMKPGMKPA